VTVNQKFKYSRNAPDPNFRVVPRITNPERNKPIHPIKRGTDIPKDYDEEEALRMALLVSTIEEQSMIENEENLDMIIQ